MVDLTVVSNVKRVNPGAYTPSTNEILHGEKGMKRAVCRIVYLT